MISICCVTLDVLSKVEQLFIESITTKCKKVDEVIIVNNDKSTDYYDEQTINNVKIKKFGSGITQKSSYGHALGLHFCIDKAKNDYILLADADMLLYTAADEIFLNLMNTYDLFAIGVSIDCPPILAATFFPFVHFLLLRKSKLPTIDFLAECDRIESLQACNFNNFPKVPLNGKFLLPGPTNHWNTFPNPNGSFDTSCNLWLWCQKQNGRWLSFQTMDQHNYNLNLYRTNFKLKEKLGNKKLVYHMISASAKLSENPSIIQDYEKVWSEIKNEN